MESDSDDPVCDNPDDDLVAPPRRRISKRLKLDCGDEYPRQMTNESSKEKDKSADSRTCARPDVGKRNSKGRST